MRLQTRGRYPSNWNVIAAAVKSEAGWKCVRCGVPHGPVPHILTVHHLDGDKSNNVWWNLIALCQRCHLSVQARVIPERAWLWEHSRWFVPYVCGYYAARSGVTITREEADATPDRWLAMGQPWRYEVVQEFPA
jgi:hypothetical protein